MRYAYLRRALYDDAEPDEALRRPTCYAPLCRGVTLYVMLFSLTKSALRLRKHKDTRRDVLFISADAADAAPRGYAIFFAIRADGYADACLL